MTHPPAPDLPDDSPGLDSSELDFDKILEETEVALAALRQRYEQVSRDRDRQAQLRDRQGQLQGQLQDQPAESELRAELKRIQMELEQLEVALESQLFSWKAIFRDGFWAIVRFGGVGVIVGWVLRGLS